MLKICGPWVSNDLGMPLLDDCGLGGSRKAPPPQGPLSTLFKSLGMLSIPEVISLSVRITSGAFCLRQLATLPLAMPLIVSEIFYIQSWVYVTCLQAFPTAKAWGDQSKLWLQDIWMLSASWLISNLKQDPRYLWKFASLTLA